MVRTAHDTLHLFGIAVRFVENAEGELHIEHAAHGRVDVFHIDFSRFDLLFERLVGRIHIEVDARHERLTRRVGTRLHGVVESLEPVDRTPVRIDEPAESQLSAQNIGHVVARTRYGHAVEGAVTAHHRQRVGLGDHAGEGIEVEVAQFALTAAHLSAVQSARRRSVRHEVFGHAGDAVFLVSPDEPDTHFGDQIGVLAEGLLDTAPAQFAGDIEHGREDLVKPHGRSLAAAGIGHAFDQRRVERTALRNGVRKERGTVLEHPLNALDAGQRGNSETRLGKHILLQLADNTLAFGCVVPHFMDGSGTLAVETVFKLTQLAGFAVLKLKHLFMQGHPREQIFDTPFYRRLSVFIKRLFCSCRAAQTANSRQREKDFFHYGLSLRLFRISHGTKLAGSNV